MDGPFRAEREKIFFDPFLDISSYLHGFGKKIFSMKISGNPGHWEEKNGSGKIQTSSRDAGTSKGGGSAEVPTLTSLQQKRKEKGNKTKQKVFVVPSPPPSCSCLMRWRFHTLYKKTTKMRQTKLGGTVSRFYFLFVKNFALKKKA